jgi:hypothetical protein
MRNYTDSTLSRIALSALVTSFVVACGPDSKGSSPQPTNDPKPAATVQGPGPNQPPASPVSDPKPNPNLKEKSSKLNVTLEGLSKPLVANIERNDNALTATLESLPSETIQSTATIRVALTQFTGEPLSDDVCKAVRNHAAMVTNPSLAPDLKQAAFNDVRKRNTITFTLNAVPFLEEQNAAVKKAATEAGLKFGTLRITNPIAFKSAKVSLKTEPGSIINLLGEKAQLEQSLQALVNSGVAKHGTAQGPLGAYDLFCDLKSGLAKIDISLEGEGFQATSQLAQISAAR